MQCKCLVSCVTGCAKLVLLCMDKSGQLDFGNILDREGSHWVHNVPACPIGPIPLSRSRSQPVGCGSSMHNKEFLNIIIFLLYITFEAANSRSLPISSFKKNSHPPLNLDVNTLWEWQIKIDKVSINSSQKHFLHNSSYCLQTFPGIT